MSDLWQEIDKLRAEVSEIEKQVGRQRALISAHPILRCGSIQSVSEKSGNTVYEIKERNVDTEKPDSFVDVRTMPNDLAYSVGQVVAFYVDEDGQRYILPSSGNNLLLVQDIDRATAKEVTVDETGTVTTPEESETLPFVVADPVGFFHESTFPTKVGRIYPALKLLQTNGVDKFYLVFVEGHGDVAKIFSSSANIEQATSITFTVTTDGQGNVLGVAVTAG